MNLFKKLFRKGDSNDQNVVKRKGEPDVFNVSNDEERMNSAMDKAKLTIGYFKRSLSKPLTHQQYFSLKAKITDGGSVEHIWLTEVSFDDDGNFFGHIGNEPVYVRNVKPGQKVGISLNEISDWMIVENGRLIGGYTIRVLREKMSEKERKTFDNGLGLFIDEGVDHYEHDFTTPEGAILCLEDAYDAKDIDRAMACKDFREEAKMMLMRNEMMKSLGENQEMVEKMEEILKLSFIKSMQEGFPSFVNVQRSFPDTKYVTRDLAIVTEVCFNPDRTKTLQKLYVSKATGEWRVLALAE